MSEAAGQREVRVGPSKEGQLVWTSKDMSRQNEVSSF